MDRPLHAAAAVQAVQCVGVAAAGGQVFEGGVRGLQTLHGEPNTDNRRLAGGSLAKGIAEKK